MKLSRFLLIPFLAASSLATPLIAAEPSTPPAEPMRMVDDFFSKLETGRVDAAYDDLLKKTKIADSPKDVNLLKTKTKEAIKMFGDMMGHDVVSTKMIGTRLIRVTCVSLGRQFPIRWRLYFYNSADAWKLIDIRIDDRLLDMFDENPAAAAPSASSADK